jgi:hypothetical protein
MDNEYLTYELGDFKLKSGGVIPNAHIAYKTFGDASLPAIIYPSWYSGGQFSLLALILRAKEQLDITDDGESLK